MLNIAQSYRASGMLDNKLLDVILEQKEKTRATYAQLAQQHLGDSTLGESLRLTLRGYRRIREGVIPEPEKSSVADYIHREQANTLIIADLHAPYHNKPLLEQAIKIAVAAGVTEVDIAGDLHDFNSLSPMSKGETTTPYETDIKSARGIIKALLYHFNIINIISGNHDEYYPKKKGGTFTDLIYNEVLQGNYSERVNASNYDYLLRGNDWIIGHLSSYDEEPGLIAAKLADKHNRNVLVGHDHVLGYMLSKKGLLGVSIGAMLLPDRFWYKVRRLNTFPDFQLGFSLIIDNKLYLFNDEGNTTYLGAPYPFEYWTKYFKEGQHK